jgi:hypothetical protein
MRARTAVCLLAVLAGPLLAGACASEDSSAPALTGAEAEALQAQLREAVADFHKVLPLRIHEKGELVGMTTEDLGLTLDFRFEDVGSDERANFADGVARNMMIGLGCASPKISDLLAKGVVVHYRFYDTEENLFFKHDLSQGDCTT